jgi:hypothetical protein
VATADSVTPPQGYIDITQDFAAATAQKGAPNGFYNMDWGLRLNSPVASHHGTFWSNQFNFLNSAKGLPANHTGGDQGGYLGVQALPEGRQMAIVSIWWAVDARPGAGAKCLSDVEMWYTDDRPFQPPITDATKTDPRRKVDGGPFRSCRLPVTLSQSVKYRLRVWQTETGWFGAWLINDATKQEQQIGELKVPRVWGGLEDGGGFMEQFGPMPNGCSSIPASDTTFFPATADAGSLTAKLSASVAHGACEKEIAARYHALKAGDGTVNVIVR